MWRISNKKKGRTIEKVERTKRGFVDLRLRKGNTSLIFSDRPTSLTKTGNHRCHYWFFFILLFSFWGRIESSILAILAKVFLFSHYRYFSFLRSYISYEESSRNVYLIREIATNALNFCLVKFFFYRSYDCTYKWLYLQRVINLKVF